MLIQFNVKLFKRQRNEIRFIIIFLGREGVSKRIHLDFIPMTCSKIIRKKLGSIFVLKLSFSVVTMLYFITRLQNPNFQLTSGLNDIILRYLHFLYSVLNIRVNFDFL